MLTLLLSQSPATSPDPLTFNQLGIAAVVCALLLAGLLIVWKQLLASQARERQLLADQVGREKEIADRIVPLLVSGLEVLTTTPAKFQQAMDQARSSTSRSELDLVLARLEDMVRDSKEPGR